MEDRRAGLLRLRPRLHVFGHVYSAYGAGSTRYTLLVNAAVLDNSCAPSLATGSQNQHVEPAESRYYYDAFGRRRKNGYLDPKDTQIKHLD